MGLLGEQRNTILILSGIFVSTAKPESLCLIVGQGPAELYRQAIEIVGGHGNEGSVSQSQEDAADSSDDLIHARSRHQALLRIARVPREGLYKGPRVRIPVQRHIL